MINEQVLKGKWKQIKGEMLHAWGQISEHDLEQAKGDVNTLTGLVQRKYGLAKDEAQKRISEIVDRFGEEKHQH